MAAPPNDHVLVLQPAVSALVNTCQQPENDPRTLLASLRAVIDASGLDVKARSIELVGVEGCALLVEKLPWELVVLFFVQLLQDDTSNLRRQQFFCRLRQLHVDKAWVREQEGLALESLASVDVVEIPWLLQVVEDSGHDYFVERVLPQLASKNLSQHFWLSLREQLEKKNEIALAKKCLDIVVHQLPPFPEQTTCYPPDENMSGPDNLVKIARICVETDSHDQLPLIFTKMRLAVKTRSAPETPARYYYALADLLIGLGEERIPVSRLPRAFLEDFFLEVLDALIFEKQTQNCQCFVVFRRASQKKSDTCPLNDENSTKILRVAAALGGVHFLRYIPGFDATALKKHDRAVVTDFARTLALNTRPENVDDPAYASYDSIVGFLLNVYPPAAGDLPSFVEFLKLALELKAYHTFKTRLPSLSTTAIDFLLRIVPRLLDLLRPCRPTPLDQELDAFAHSVFKSFGDKLHRFRTRDFATLAGFGCEAGAKCFHGCSELRSWLLGDSDIMDDEKYEVMRKKDSREHLEQTLGQLRDRATIPLKWHTSYGTNPHTLVVTKTPHDTWRLRKTIPRANEFMAALGDVEEQKRILGGHYEFVREEINKARWPSPKHTASDSRKRPASTQLAAPVLQRQRTASSSGSSREPADLISSDDEIAGLER